MYEECDYVDLFTLLFVMTYSRVISYCIGVKVLLPRLTSVIIIGFSIIHFSVKEKSLTVTIIGQRNIILS